MVVDLSLLYSLEKGLPCRYTALSHRGTHNRCVTIIKVHGVDDLRHVLYALVITSVILFWYRHPWAFAARHVVPLIRTLYPLNIAQSLIVTSLIGYKVWHQYLLRKSAGLYEDGEVCIAVLTAIKIIIESSTLFTVQQAILYTLSFLKRPSQYLVQGLLAPCIGECLLLEIVRWQLIAPMDRRGIQSLHNSDVRQRECPLAERRLRVDSHQHSCHGVGGL